MSKTNEKLNTTKLVDEWRFKKKRDELIKMMKNALEAKVNPDMAANYVDACVIASWDYLAEKEA